MIGAVRYKEHFILDKNYLETKKLVLRHDLDKVFRKASRLSFFGGDNSELLDFKDCYGEEVYKVARNIENSKRSKTKRARKRIGKSILKGNAYFITLTFTDDVLGKTNAKTRRRYVSRFLKENCDRYVANIDFGSQKEREHYHAIVEPYWWVFDDYDNGSRHYSDMPDFRGWNKYGFFSIEKIGDSEKDMTKVTKYTTKLSAHAVKETTLKGESTPRLIYSRKQFRIRSLQYLTPKRSTNAK